MRLSTFSSSLITAVVLFSAINVLLLLTRSQQNQFHLPPIPFVAWDQTTTSFATIYDVNRRIANGSQKFEASAVGLLCRHSTRPRDSDIIWISSSTWQLQVTQIGKQVHSIYVYSAYYDDRPSSGFLPSVRVLALSTLKRDVPIFCSVWYDGETYADTVRAVVNAEAGTGYVYDRQNHREYAYICQLVDAVRLPTHVSILAVTSCCPSGHGCTTLVPVRRTLRTEQQPIEFGVCVTAGYGYIEPEVFVEWVELNRMFGAVEINLYDTWYAKNMSAVFDYYRSRGILRVHRLYHPKHNHPSWFFNKVRNLRIIALNDCQLMNMYRYRYILVIDTDEVIVPRTTSNYSALVTELDRQRNVPGVSCWTYVFLNIYFLLDFPPDTTKPPYLRTILYRHRVRPKSYGYAPKSMVDPRRCSVAFNHYCARYLVRPASPKLKRTFRVPFRMASSHHYRRCGRFYAYTCDQLFAEKTPDDFMLTYERQLNASVADVLTGMKVL